MATITIKCSWCGRYYSAQRKSSKYCGGTCRQQAHRSGQKKPTPRPVGGVGDFYDDWLKALDRGDEFRDELFTARSRNVELEIELNKLHIELRKRGSNGGGAVTPDQWERLSNMDNQQLRQWVMSGRTMARSGRDSPVDNAIRWVEENRVEPSGPLPR